MKFERNAGFPGRLWFGISRACLAIVLAYALNGCASVPPQTEATETIKIFTELPAGVVGEPIGKITVTHGRGCGLFGAMGSREGALMLVRQKAVAAGADAALVTGWSEPHIRGNCRVNRYELAATLLRLPRLKYTPPATREDLRQEFRYVVPATYDETWTSLVDAVASSFFEVRNYEKDSGLLTLAFDPETPSEYVDCGEWERSYPNGEVGFAGPYVDHLMKDGNFDLPTRINLRVKSLGAYRTEIEITTLYEIKAPAYKISFRFKTNTVSRKTLSSGTTKAPGTLDYRTCQSTHKLEHELLSEIAMISSGS